MVQALSIFLVDACGMNYPRIFLSRIVPVIASHQTGRRPDESRRPGRVDLHLVWCYLIPGAPDTIAQNTKKPHPCSYSRLNSYDRVRVRVGVPGYALSTSRSRSTVTMLTCDTATLPLPPSIVLVLSTAVLVLVICTPTYTRNS